MFIGGSNVSDGEAIAAIARDTLFDPFRISIMLDSNGANSTAAAAVLSATKHVSLEETQSLVLAATGDRASLGQDPIVRDKMATLACEIEIGRQLMMHCAELAADGVTPPEYGAISKVYSGELMERFGEAALDILGMRAAISEQMPGAIDNGRFEQNLRHSLMWVISIGTNEIQRSLIAQRGLGLPR